ncbi:MAG TPA: DNA polymerase III subunit alpha [Dehalococcoidia bacterium]|nr:DNA polymerase III subunit alpha [Dehalococcoidia bacterium]
MFTHLHTHTEFSLLDGLSRIPALMDRAKEIGQEAIAITDHGVLYGAIQFYKEAKARGIKPIIGIEAYVAQGSRFDRDPQAKQPYHLIILAKNEDGYRNLLALSTKAHLEGYYYRPRMDRELLEKHHEGLIVLSGCPTGEVSRHLVDGNFDKAKEVTAYYKQLFGDYYIEVQEHGIEEFAELKQRQFQLAQETGLPLVATNDLHYVKKEDATYQDILLCIGTNANVDEENRFKMSGHFGCYDLKSEDEMRELFPDHPEAIDNTWQIAQMCDLELEFGRTRIPTAQLPAGETSEQHLERLCREGLARLYPGEPTEAVERLEYELDVIQQTGFSDYILCVHDFAHHARKQNIQMALRGSAAASIVLYCLGVTDIDPLEYRLVFERFLNVERKEMPDVDMDFAEDRRDEMIRYAAERYGHDRVAQIITFGTLGAKASIRDVGRALGMSYVDVDRVARLVPTMPASFGSMTIDVALKEGAELRQAYDSDPAVRKLIDYAHEVEGVARHASTHAAGVVIAPEPLVNLLPLQRSSSGNEDALPTTQYGMWDVAELGLLKMDFLGLTNLTILAAARDVIKASQGVDIDLQKLPDGDEQVSQMLSRGETFGVFQLESAGMRRYVQDLKPNSIKDLAAMVALYRPGPMQHIPTYINAKHGRETVRYPHADLGEILDETYGVIVYQDQVLLIAQKFAGYTLGEADIMRKAMGKKIRSIMAKQEQKFMEGAAAKGYSEADARAIFRLIEPFAGYAFNKAHSVSYGIIAYQTAYLKANYPEEYMTAVLMMAGTHERIAEAYGECVRLGIHLLQPDVNASESNFSLQTPDDAPSTAATAALRTGTKAIRYGLARVKNVGEGVCESIIEARNAGGPFKSLDDFFERVDSKVLNKRALECLVKAGAFDALAERAALLASLDKLVTYAQNTQAQKASGQTSLFDLMGDDEPAVQGPQLEPVREATQQQKLTWEKELLGIYLSEHPFADAAEKLSALLDCSIVELSSEFAGRDVTIGGVITSTRSLNTRDGRSFLAAEIEDQTGSIEITVWPETLEATHDLWTAGTVLVVNARVKQRDDRLSVAVNKAVVYEPDQRFDPASVLPDYSQPQTPDRFRYRRKPANGNNGNGNSNGRSTEASDTNGAAPANGNGASPAPRPTPLRIVIEETDDADGDSERLRALIAAVNESTGSQAARLSIRQTNGEEVDLELPAVSLSPELTRRLADIVGPWGHVLS